MRLLWNGLSLGRRDGLTWPLGPLWPGALTQARQAEGRLCKAKSATSIPLRKQVPWPLTCGPSLGTDLLSQQKSTALRERQVSHPLLQVTSVLLICKKSRQLISSITLLCLQLPLFYIFKCAAGKGAQKLFLAPLESFPNSLFF